MAFTCKREFLGLELNDSFNIIENTSSYRNNGECTLQVYVSKEAYDKKTNFLFSEQYNFPIKFGESEGSDRYQAYLHLMSLEQFKEAKLILVDQTT